MNDENDVNLTRVCFSRIRAHVSIYTLFISPIVRIYLFYILEFIE